MSSDTVIGPAGEGKTSAFDIAGAGYIPCIEQPTALARLPRGFLANVPTGES